MPLYSVVRLFGTSHGAGGTDRPVKALPRWTFHAAGSAISWPSTVPMPRLAG